MTKSNYTVNKTYRSLYNLESTAKALVVSGCLEPDDEQEIYSIYEKLSKISSTYRWDNMKEIDPESYDRNMESGQYQKYEAARKNTRDTTQKLEQMQKEFFATGS